MSSEIIDSHVHLVLPVESQVEILKNAGVGRAVLFPTLIHPEKAENREEFKKEIGILNSILRGETNPVEARISSIEELVSVINEHKDMFTGFGSVPAGMDYDSTAEWIDKHIVRNGLAGVGEVSFGAGEAHKTENIFKVLSGYTGTYPVWIHTFNPLLLDDIKTLAGYSEKYPGVKIIFGHGGGSFWLETIELIREKKNIYFDISASFSILPLKYAAQEFPERVLFSSDMPYGDPLLSRGVVEHVISERNIRSMILGGNISRLLGL